MTLPTIASATALLQSAERSAVPTRRQPTVRLSYDFLYSLYRATRRGAITPEPVRIDIPGWDRVQALKALRVRQAPFEWDLANRKGYARGRAISVSPFDPVPHLTLFHELGHVLLGHSTRRRLPEEETPNVNAEHECHAEAIAWLCAVALDLSDERSAGYIATYRPQCQQDPFTAADVEQLVSVAQQILAAGAVHHAEGVPSGTSDASSEDVIQGALEMRDVLGVEALATKMRISVAEARQRCEDDPELMELADDLGDAETARRAGLPAWVVEECIADASENGAVIPPATLATAAARFRATRSRSATAARHTAPEPSYATA